MVLLQLVCLLLFNAFIFTVLADDDFQSCKAISDTMNSKCFQRCTGLYCLPNPNVLDDILCRDRPEKGCCRIDSNVALHACTTYNAFQNDVMTDINRECWETCKTGDNVCLYRRSEDERTMILECSTEPLHGGGNQCWMIHPPDYRSCNKKDVVCEKCLFSQRYCNLAGGICSVDGHNIREGNSWGKDTCLIRDTSENICAGFSSKQKQCQWRCTMHNYCSSDKCGDDKHKMAAMGLCKMAKTISNDRITVHVKNSCVNTIYIAVEMESNSHKSYRQPANSNSELGFGEILKYTFNANTRTRVMAFETRDIDPERPYELTEATMDSRNDHMTRDMTLVSYFISNAESIFMPVKIRGKDYKRGDCSPINCGVGNNHNMDRCPLLNQRHSKTLSRPYCISSNLIPCNDISKKAIPCETKAQKRKYRYTVRSSDVSSYGCSKEGHPNKCGCLIVPIVDTKKCITHCTEIAKMQEYTAFSHDICPLAFGAIDDDVPPASVQLDCDSAPPSRYHTCMTDEIIVEYCPTNAN